MRTLYHFPLQPQSRKLRLLLKEKHLDCDLVLERPWERRTEFLRAFIGQLRSEIAP